ncbi:MAG: hypothetical protein RLN76_00450 [Phycisphaeraceae bacterium]
MIAIRTPSRMLLLAIIVLLSSLTQHAHGQATKLDDRAQLMVDDVLIASEKNTRYVIHQAKKLAQPVVEADRPWESNRVYLYGTVLRDPSTGRFRMWYSGGGLAYAESADGLNWIKPELPYHQHNGQNTNVLVTGSNLTCVIYDPEEPEPAFRYRLLDNTKHHDFIGFHSADGLEWKRYPKTPLLAQGSELIDAVRDPSSGQFIAYIRPYLPRHHPKNNTEKRLIAVTTSPDFQTWSPMKVVIEPDPIDDAWTSREGQRTEFYAMAGFPYGSQYLGMLMVFRITEIIENQAPGQSKYEGPIHVELVHSRDGLHWERSTPRTPIIDNGPYGYDAGAIMDTANLPVIVGDEVWMYYTALTTSHGGKLPEKRASIGLARWRLDGFVSRDTASDEGELITKPLILPEGRLTLNVAAPAGSVRVEILGQNGRPIPGYTLNESIPFTGDSVSARIQWREQVNVPTDRPVQLRFVSKNASLFSYRIAGDRP